MNSPHDLIQVASDDLAEGTKLMTSQAVDPTTIAQIQARFACSQAASALAIAQLLADHFGDEFERNALADPAFVARMQEAVADPETVEVQRAPRRRPYPIESDREMISVIQELLRGSEAEPYETLKRIRDLLD